jgi:hypothetical protein
MNSEQTSPQPRRSLRESIAAHLGSGQVARVIYGSIIGLALVVVLDAHAASAGAAVGSLLATALAVAMAELYSEIIGTETRETLPRQGLVQLPRTETVERGRNLSYARCRAS